MECKHGAFLEVDGGIKCLLCGQFITQKQAEKAVDEHKTDKPQAKKRTAKKAV